MKTQDKITSEVKKEEMEQVLKPEMENMEERTKDWFDIAKDATFGFFFAVAWIILGITALYCAYSWTLIGYDWWFGSDGFIEVGERGYYYDSVNDCFVKPRPNRRVLKDCLSLKHENGDSIGIVQVRKGIYRYVNLNTLSFINKQSYEHADLFRNGVAIALANDTIYHISADGKTLSAEPSTWIYGSVEEITYLEDVGESDEDAFTEEVSTGLFMYEDTNGNFGLMTSDFVRLTPALYSDITAKSKEVFFCEYFDSGLGVLIDKSGNYIK